jgi:hypothetical protein
LLWDLTGQVRESKLKPVTPTAAELAALWSDLLGTAQQADQAIWVLALSPKQSLPFLGEHMRPLPPITVDHLPKLLPALDSDQFAARQHAVQALAEIDEGAAAALEAILKGTPTLEARRRLEGILDKREKEAIRKLRAIEAIELIGTAEARQTLAAPTLV